MIKSILKILLVLFMVAGFTACSGRVDKTGYVLPENNNIKCNFYNEKDFRSSVEQANGVMSDKKDIRGGIVSHHLLASGMIASFFQSFSGNKYDDVIVVAPNHKRIGKSSVNTAKESWDTPFGVLNAEENLIQELTNDGVAGLNPSVMQEDHSISALVPFIKYYLPDSKIIPLLIHGNYGLENSINLGQIIKKKMEGKKYLVIASVDFSHYLTAEKADEMDEITIRAIKDRNLKGISRMTNDNLDSPPSIITLLTVMNENRINNSIVLGHNNSARISHQYSSSSTTSYFTVLFYK